MFEHPHSLLGDHARLEAEYDAWLNRVFDLPIWSSLAPLAPRVIWTDVPAAMATLRASFESPGMYLFGSQREPLYMGSATGTIIERLRRRYIGPKRSQCQIALDYEDVLREKGADGLPQEIWQWYRRHNGKVRLVHAAEFAKRGAASIWIGLIPIAERAIVKSLERELIPVASSWNLRHGLPPLLNTQHNPARAAHGA